MSRIETYDNEGNVIAVTDDRNLADEQNRLIAEVNAYRMDVMNSTGIWVFGHRWDTDEIARSNITGASTALAVGVPLPEGFTWRSADNANVPFNAQMMVGLGAYAMQWVNYVYAASWQMKAEIQALESLEDIDAYDIFDVSHWPDNDMDGSKPT